MINRIRSSNICQIGVPQGGNKENGLRQYSKIKGLSIFHDFNFTVKERKFPGCSSMLSLSRMNESKSTPSHIMVKLQTVKDKENFKVHQRKDI